MARTYYTPPPDPPIPSGWTVAARYSARSGERIASAYTRQGRHGRYRVRQVHAEGWEVWLFLPHRILNLGCCLDVLDAFWLAETHDRVPF